MLGEVAFFLGILQPMTVRARPDGDVQLLVLTREDSDDLFNNYQEEVQACQSSHEKDLPNDFTFLTEHVHELSLIPVFALGLKSVQLEIIRGNILFKCGLDVLGNPSSQV